MEWYGLISLVSEMKPQEGVGIHESDQPQKDAALKLLQPAYLRLGLFRMPKQPGLGEALGKGSLANTAFRSSRWVPMTYGNRGMWRAGDLIPLKHGLMKPWRGFCPDHLR